MKCIDCLYVVTWNRTCEEHNKNLTHNNLMELKPVECEDFRQNPERKNEND